MHNDNKSLLGASTDRSLVFEIKGEYTYSRHISVNHQPSIYSSSINLSDTLSDLLIFYSAERQAVDGRHVEFRESGEGRRGGLVLRNVNIPR